jgi:hypothetical protein
MQSDHTLMGLNVSEWALVLNAVTVMILVIINAYYLKIAKAQAEAANAQAKESLVRNVGTLLLRLFASSQTIGLWSCIMPAGSQPSSAIKLFASTPFSLELITTLLASPVRGTHPCSKPLTRTSLRSHQS